MTIGNGDDLKSVQDILGHSTLALTMNTYAKATDSGKCRATDVLPFATMSSPEGIIPMQNARAARTPNVDTTQNAKRQWVA